MPFDKEGVGGFTLAGSKSTTALISLGALDKEAARIVVETWPFAPLADGAGIKLVACSLIFGHALFSWIFGKGVLSMGSSMLWLMLLVLARVTAAPYLRAIG